MVPRIRREIKQKLGVIARPRRFAHSGKIGAPHSGARMNPNSASTTQARRDPPLAKALGAGAGVLATVLGGHAPDAALSAVEPALRAAALDLSHTALRDFGRGDFILHRLLTQPLKDKPARALLLIALSRLERQPDAEHTVVDQAVDAAARIAGGRFKGLVNGVLRNFLRQRTDLLAAADADDIALWRHPAWWIERLRHDHPRDWQALLAAGNGRAPMALRVNRRRAAKPDFLRRLAEAGIEARDMAGDAVLLARPMAAERVPGFAAGEVSVQDAGAQAAAALLDVADGMRVLDACAAPGGKTAHLLERADVDLLALDASAERAARIGRNLDRLGLAARVVAEDCRDLAKWWDGRPFDRILADVPCSASGVVRRHPDAKWLRRAGDIAGFAARQAEIVDALWRVLAPGGKMLYVTCSLFVAENAAQVTAFVGRHADARRLPIAGEETERQLFPDAEHDGFYFALLEKA